MERITISLSEWVIETYLSGIYTNRSKYIEELIIKGSELTSGEFSETKRKVLDLSKRLREVQEQLNKCKFLNASLKDRLKGKRTLSDIEKGAEAIINRGLHNF